MFFLYFNVFYRIYQTEENTGILVYYPERKKPGKDQYFTFTANLLLLSLVVLVVTGYVLLCIKGLRSTGVTERVYEVTERNDDYAALYA